MSNDKKFHKRESGQIVLITVLVLSIATTVALSIIARTTTDQAISTQVEESARAFSAAEAGIEEALRTGVGTNGARTLAGDASYSVTVTNISGGVGVYQFPQKTTTASTETLWLVDHTADGKLVESPTYTFDTIDLCWSQEPTRPAVTVAILYKTSGNYRVARVAYDPDATRALSNKFTNPLTASANGCGVASMYRQTIRFSDLGINSAVDTVLALRMRPLYSETQIALDAPIAIPVQGRRIESVGSLQSGVTRKILVNQQFRSAASIFDAAVFSQAAFAK